MIVVEYDIISKHLKRNRQVNISLKGSSWSKKKGKNDDDLTTLNLNR